MPLEGGSFPDPGLCAHVYYRGDLDAVVREAVLPSWRAFEQDHHEHSSYLWFLRYGRGGEHLKVRWHGPEAEVRSLRDSFPAAVEELLAKPVEPVEDTAPNGKAPPIDLEDEGAHEHCDRSWRWTTYRRSHVSLGYKPFLDDDRHVALMTRALGLGAEHALLLLAGGNGVRIAQSPRQSSLVRQVIHGLAELEPASRSHYLLYHRNWLLRYILAQLEAPPEEAVTLLSRFDRHLDGSRRAVAQVGEMAQDAWSHRRGPAGRWRTAVEALIAHTSSLVEDDDFDVDPFAPDRRFPVLFKLFHGIANALGAEITNEAFTHHMLLTAACPDADIRQPLTAVLRL